MKKHLPPWQVLSDRRQTPPLLHVKVGFSHFLENQLPQPS